MARQQQSVKAEEMNLDSSLDAMIKRVNDIKASINQFLWKLDHEHETLNWPSVLDSFALLSSQLCTLQKLLTNEKTAQLKNYVFVPLHLQPDRDMELEKLTEGRVSSFNHEIVPDYLRTKPEMDVESKQKTVADKAANISADAATKQITALNKICNSMILLVQNKKDEWKNEEGSRKVPEATKRDDTISLVAAITQGKGLADMRPTAPQMHPMKPELAAPQHMMPRAPIPQINMGGPRPMRPNIRMQPHYQHQRP